jgi:hypothetical protein
MALSSNYIDFINHASVIIKGNNKSVLTDPWFEGSVFHDGWKLLYENPDDGINEMLQTINYIWISHEHPDHFSIPFFKKYKEILIGHEIKILFQKTKDLRVAQFLRGLGLSVIELESNEFFEIEDGFSLKIIKDEFYDSALIAYVNGCIIFNINDCPLHELNRIEEFRKRYGTCDILLTQFSYAAWKGGPENLQWRRGAAREKLRSLLNQGLIFEAKVVIPFASFVWFSNLKNFYLNDSINLPKDVLAYCAENNAPFDVIFLAPYERLTAVHSPKGYDQKVESIQFWDDAYKTISEAHASTFVDPASLIVLQDLFHRYRDRILEKNSQWLIWILSKIPRLNAFKPIAILIEDLEIVVLVDFLKGKLKLSQDRPEISMHSASLAYIFKYPFGFDTLTVNGCFDEVKAGGFGKLSKVFALENLNNLGIYLKSSIIFNVDVIFIFMRRLMKVKARMHGVSSN